MAVFVLVAALASFATAGVNFTFSTKYPDPRVNVQTPPIKFLSGTNCEAQCVYQVTSPTPGLKKVELWLSGKINGGATETTKVASWTKEPLPPPGEEQPPGYPLVPVMTLKVKFAATHFQHMTNLTLIGKAWDEADQPYEQSFVEPNKIYDAGMVYEHPDFYFGNSGGIAAELALQSMNHSTADRTAYGSGWTSGQFLEDVYGVTAGHIGTHGSAAGLFDSQGALIETSYIRQMCWNGVNSAYGYPAVNLMFFDACNIGQTGVLSAVLCTPDMHTVDRAAIGFNIVLESAGSPAMGRAFWGALQRGLVAYEALDRAVAAYNNVAITKGFAKLGSGDSVLKGDRYCRLWLVYTGSAGKSSDKWYMVVQP